MGRPPINIDWNVFDSLVQMHCTEEEIAYVFKCDVDTITNRCKERFGMTFSEYYKRNSVGGRMSLRRQLWLNALGDAKAGVKAHAATAIFLSKQKESHGGLGFSDKTRLQLPIDGGEAGGTDDGAGQYEWKMGMVARLKSKKSKEKV